MRTSIPLLIATVLACVCVGANAQAAAPDSAQETLKQYLQAENQFDLPSLRKLLDIDFVEVSPLGQVDTHEQVLSFYAPDKKVPAPPIEVGQIRANHHGDTTLMTTQVSYQMGGRTMSLTLGAAARYTDAGWKLLWAQYTPQRPQQPTPAK